MKGRTRKPHAYHRKARHELEKVPVTPAHLRQPNGTSQQRSRSVTHLSSLVRIISRTSNEGLQKHSRKLRQQSKACRPPTSRKPTLHPHCTAAQAHETQPNALRPVRHATSRALGQPEGAAQAKQEQLCRKASFARPTARSLSKRNLGWQRMGLVQRIPSRQGGTGVHVSVAVCHSTSKAIIFFSTPSAWPPANERLARARKRRRKKPSRAESNQ
jgi:hypothetical protein